MIVLDKPAGLPVHKGPKGGPNLEELFDALRFGLPAAPALAHRLDRDTSGCLVLGRHRKALARLGRLFQAGRIGKTYWAVTVGVPAAVAGRIELPLAKRSTAARGWWMKPDPAGQAAVTDWRVLAADAGLAWLELHPRTGRTHQIRVHLAELGCPVLGDPVYGDGDTRGAALHLHSRAVTLPLYERRPAVEVTAGVPEPMASTLMVLGVQRSALARGLGDAASTAAPAASPAAPA